jgi:cytochrome c-type biogenesis protein CcmH/NrfF
MKSVKLMGAALAACALMAGTAFAAPREAAPTAFDPIAHQRVVEVSEQLRCLVCQNQSIADSNAELAVDLRNQVIEQVKAGKTNKEIVDYMVERYGDFVLYKPPRSSSGSAPSRSSSWASPRSTSTSAAASRPSPRPSVRSPPRKRPARTSCSRATRSNRC